MTPERWRRVESLFEGALAIPDSGRQAWLRQECADDDSLFDRIAGMLRESATSSIIGSVVRNNIAGISLVPAAEGSRFGPYRVVGILGRGGMGTVYEGVRDDGAFEQRVAIKVVQTVFSGDALAIERFHRERRVLASLDHPNIARLLDGGETPLAWLAMEKVEGTRLDKWAAGKSTADKLRMVATICEAVQFAHSRLVLHRDLKPANVLVTAAGVPKLLDFGIARFLPGGDAAESGLTMTGLQPMTPEYASPEQIRGEEIGVASDVYSLGCVLYRLLTGSPPHTLTGRTASQIESEVSIADVRRPSEIAEGGSALRGDIDTIVLTALAKEPARRYQSAGALAADIRAHLEGLVISARPATVGYRVNRFVRRHVWGVAAIAGIIVSLAAGLAIALEQRRVADERFREVRQLANRFLFEFDDSIRNIQGTTKSRQLIVETAKQYLDQLSRASGRDIGHTAELATAWQKLGDIQGNASMASLGRREEALASYRKSAELWQKVRVAKPKDVNVLRSLSSVQGFLGAMLYSEERFDESLPWSTAARESALAAMAMAPDDVPTITQAVTAMLLQSDRISIRDPKAGQKIALEALDVAQRALERKPDDHLRSAVAVCLSRLGRLASSFDDAASARDYHERSLAIREYLLQQTPGEQNRKRSVSTGETNLAAVLFSTLSTGLNDPVGSTVHMRRSIVLLREMIAADPANRTAQGDLVLSLMRMCEALAAYRPAEAIPVCDEAIQSPGVKGQADVAEWAVIAEVARAKAQLALHKDSAAAETARDVVARLSKFPKEGIINLDFQRARAWDVLGSALLAQGQRSQARDAWRRANALFAGDLKPMGYRDLELVALVNGRLATVDPAIRCSAVQRAEAARSEIASRKLPPVAAAEPAPDCPVAK